MLAFGPFAGAAATMVSVELAPSFGLAEMLAPIAIPLAALPLVVVITGLGSIFCSAMIYIDTPRPLWKYGKTLERFCASAGLGLAVGLCSGFGFFTSLFCLGFSIFLKIRMETAVQRNNKHAELLSPSLSLLEHELKHETRWRYVGMIAWVAFTAMTQNALSFSVSILAVLFLEVCERRDFFRAGIAPRSLQN
jgi:hypothetical protein